jgi:hypothetical protein
MDRSKVAEEKIIYQDIGGNTNGPKEFEDVRSTVTF